MGVVLTSKGSFKNVNRFLATMRKRRIYDALDKIAEKGVIDLESQTPRRTGYTANSWGYDIDSRPGEYVITFTNNSINKGANIALLIQFGHGTGTGGYVQGYDYINPALKPTFDRIADKAWKAVTSA